MPIPGFVSARTTQVAPSRSAATMIAAARKIGLLVIGIACLVLAGWYLDVETLKRVVPRMVAMNPATAVAFILAGIAILSLRTASRAAVRPPLAVACGAVVALIGLAKLAEISLGWSLQIDQLMFRSRLGASPFTPPNRMAPNTAINFVLLGTGLALFEVRIRKGLWPAQILALVCGLMALLSVAGYAYSVDSVAGQATFIPMAIHTAVCFLLMGTGVLFASAERGFMSVLSSDRLSGVTARRLLPPAILIPLGVGWLRIAGERCGLYDTELGTALHVITIIAVLSVVVWWNAKSLSRVYEAHQRAERSLFESEERLHLALSCSGLATWRWDLVNDSVRWSSLGPHLFGLGTEGMPESTAALALRVHPGDRKRLARELRAAIGRRMELDTQVGVVWPDGERHVLGVRGSIVRTDPSGTETESMTGVCWDVTARARAREELDQALIQQVELRDQFVSNVSHELRSPLTAIYQFVTIVLDGLAGELTSEQHEYLEIALRNVRQLRGMIGDLLDMTRARSGKLAIEPVCMGVEDVLRETVGTLAAATVAHGLRLTAEVPRGLPCVLADPQRLRQILTNLIDNAIKFTPEGGAIRVTAELLDPGTLIRVSVADTGCGIRRDECERVFEHMYQVAGALERSRRGLGLGLTICRELVTRQGGRIWAESTLGQGSTFRFTLPVFSLEALLGPLLTPENLARGPIRLLRFRLLRRGGRALTATHEPLLAAARRTIEGCLTPATDLLLPRVDQPGGACCVVTFADSAGAGVLAARIEHELPLGPEAHLASLEVTTTVVTIDVARDHGTADKTDVGKRLATDLMSRLETLDLVETV